ncbi:flagellar motor switch protein FliM [Candidatus Contubernalis alkaliaceticus]|uniref:flagellar motor switch protein FliM n=1 Tax=Candidatus Contubernalis alkaliaceticus TaxID=338645 RepID=UPI001F4C321F|nr:flagellar motor switch protein FliM [Candidatus Contubernalis alkalaceticus]UNC91772.1 flagellar motor switch protein FliM [Candidatus Contubernalis alkalaceticus]
MDKDILSQSEIDSLISALHTGDLPDDQTTKVEVQPGDAVLYDFRKPNKFSKEHIRTLKIVHENFARVISNFLSAYLRLPVMIKLVSIGQVSYEEFIFNLPLPTLMTVFRLSDRMGSAMLETNPYFMFPIIDILFGGEGNVLKKARELTEIELSVMKRVNSKILDNLSYAWKDITPISPEIEGLDVNPQFNQMVASNETVVLLTFSTDIGSIDGFLNICFPYLTLEKVLTKLSAQSWFSGKSKFREKSSQDEERVSKKLKEAEVEMVALLGKATITVQDFLNFEKGDVIRLDRRINEPVDLYIEKEPVFKASLGVIGEKMGCVINDVRSQGGKSGG